MAYFVKFFCQQFSGVLVSFTISMIFPDYNPLTGGGGGGGGYRPPARRGGGG